MNENSNEIKTHPKKPTLLEEYIKRNKIKPEKNHVNRNFTPHDNFSLTNTFENTFQIRSNRCKLREEQEEKTKNPRPHSKKVTQPNFSFNVTSLFKNDNSNYKNNYRSLRRTNYKKNNQDNALDIIFSKNNLKHQNVKKKKIEPPRFKKLKKDHVKELIPNLIEKDFQKNNNEFPIYPHKVPYNVILQGIKENQQTLYAYC